MFGLGIWEIALIGIVALLVLGPDKLPDAARSLGKALNDFRRAGEDMKRDIMETPPTPKVATPKPLPPAETVAKGSELDVTPGGAEVEVPVASPPVPTEPTTAAPPSEESKV